MYKFRNRMFIIVLACLTALLASVQSSYAVSAFCTTNPSGSAGHVVNLTQASSFTTENIPLEQNETLNFAITQMNGNPANLPEVRITAPFAIAPTGVVFDSPIAAGVTSNATLQETRIIATTAVTLFLSGSGVPGSGIPVSATIVITCTPAPPAAPSVSGITPNSGTTLGGTSVTITGTNFTGVTAVTIGGVAVTGFSFVSDTSITATTPAGTVGTASVLVTTPGGTNTANTLYTFATPPPTSVPTVTNISPNSGTTLGGTSVTITGTNFTGVTAVTIGGVAVTGFSFVSDTSITATTPPGTVGTASVLVTTPDGTNTASTLFTYDSGSPPPPSPADEVKIRQYQDTQRAVVRNLIGTPIGIELQLHEVLKSLKKTVDEIRNAKLAKLKKLEEQLAILEEQHTGEKKPDETFPGSGPARLPNNNSLDELIAIVELTKEIDELRVDLGMPTISEEKELLAKLKKLEKQLSSLESLFTSRISRNAFLGDTASADNIGEDELNKLRNDINDLIKQIDELRTRLGMITLSEEMEIKLNKSNLSTTEFFLRLTERDLTKKYREIRKAEREQLNADREYERNKKYKGRKISPKFHDEDRKARAAKIEKLKAEARMLEERVEQDYEHVDMLRKKLGLPIKVRRVTNQVGGVLALPYVDENKTQSPVNNAIDNAFTLNSTGDGIKFLARLGDLSDATNRTWISGDISILSDGSVANREGYNARIAIGTAWRLSQRMAAVAEINAIDGRYDIGATSSNNDYQGIGATAGLGYNLSQDLSGQFIAFYNHAWVDTTLGADTGSYTADIFGITANLQGSFNSENIQFTPKIGVGYVWNSIGGFTDSSGTVVPGSHNSSGNISASLRAERDYIGSDLGLDNIVSWTPFSQIGFIHNFSQQNTFTFGPGVTVVDSNTSGNIRIGSDIIFANGSFLNGSAFGSTAFDGSLTSVGGNVQLGVRF